MAFDEAVAPIRRAVRGLGEAQADQRRSGGRLLQRRRGLEPGDGGGGPAQGRRREHVLGGVRRRGLGRERVRVDRVEAVRDDPPPAPRRQCRVQRALSTHGVAQRRAARLRQLDSYLRPERAGPARRDGGADRRGLRRTVCRVSPLPDSRPRRVVPARAGADAPAADQRDSRSPRGETRAICGGIAGRCAAVQLELLDARRRGRSVPAAAGVFIGVPARVPARQQRRAVRQRRAPVAARPGVVSRLDPAPAGHHEHGGQHRVARAVHGLPDRGVRQPAAHRVQDQRPVGQDGGQGVRTHDAAGGDRGPEEIGIRRAAGELVPVEGGHGRTHRGAGGPRVFGPLRSIRSCAALSASIARAPAITPSCSGPC